ncbi:RNA polymerase sigma factor [Lentisphaerota bacterium WC36G]|nr:RNA polymerase sigma factor [Lentisphaerae bacterium WC36]
MNKKKIEELDNDLQIINSVIDGDIEQYELLMTKYKQKVFSVIANRVPPSEYDAMLQETFISAFQSLKNYSNEYPFSSWLSGIAYRKCCNYWRNISRSKEMNETSLSKDEDFSVIDLANNMLSSGSLSEFTQEDFTIIMKNINSSLAEDDRLLIELYYFEEKSLKEVANILGWGESKTKVRAMRARKKMRKIVEKLMEQGVI